MYTNIGEGGSLYLTIHNSSFDGSDTTREGAAIHITGDGNQFATISDSNFTRSDAGSHAGAMRVTVLNNAEIDIRWMLRRCRFSDNIGVVWEERFISM